MLTSKAHTHRDRSTGATESQSESAGADACVAPDEGSCQVDLEVLKSQSSSSSDGNTSGSSTMARLELAGQEVINLNQSQSGAVPPGCEPPSLACVDANQGETNAEDGVTGQSQDALDVSVLSDTLGGAVQLSNTEIAASAGQPPAGTVPDQGPSGGTSAGSQPGDNDGGGGNGGGSGMLPNAGGVWSGLMSIAMAAIAAGSFLIARKRRNGALA